MTEITTVPDAEWRMDTAFMARPYPPRPVYAGKTVIGHIHDFERSLPERIIAVGNDPDIQRSLDEWYEDWLRKKDEERKYHSRRFILENKLKKKREIKEARTALGLQNTYKGEYK